MTWNGTGTFNPPVPPDFPAVAGNVILAGRFNTVINALCAGFSNTITRDGQNTPTGNLPMGNWKHTGVADGVANSDYASVGQMNAAIATAVAGGVAAAAAFPSGTLLTFPQAAAPTGWTQSAVHNDKALRVVGGAGGGGAGGSVPFTGAFTGGRVTDTLAPLTGYPDNSTTGGPSTNTSDGPNTNTTGSTAISIAQMPSHTHTQTASGTSGGLVGAQIGVAFGSSGATNELTLATGGGAGHTHDLQSHTHTLGNHTHVHSHYHQVNAHSHVLNLDVQYVNLIICSKD